MKRVIVVVLVFGACAAPPLGVLPTTTTVAVEPATTTVSSTTSVLPSTTSPVAIPTTTTTPETTTPSTVMASTVEPAGSTHPVFGAVTGDGTAAFPSVTKAAADAFSEDPWVVRLEGLGVEFFTGNDSHVVSGTVAASCPVVGDPTNARPSPPCTPGAISFPRLANALAAGTVCGPTSMFRPPASATAATKTQEIAAEQLTTAPSVTELDHLIPLELCGASVAADLWAEPPLPGATSTHNPKDNVEAVLAGRVKAGTVSVSHAAYLIVSDWTTATAG